MNEHERNRFIKIITWCMVASITILLWHQVWKSVTGT